MNYLTKKPLWFFLALFIEHGTATFERVGKKCYGELGCLDDWDLFQLNRPLNLSPLDREVINTQFMLYTRENRSQGQMLEVQSVMTIQKSNFDAKKATKFIIHGFTDMGKNPWIEKMKNELLKHSDWNVIVVDWAGGSEAGKLLPRYLQATANTRVVGLEIAYFINYLKDNMDLNPKDVHLIGHSLGAHTAGYAGKGIKGLGRITGLDPAGPSFQGIPPDMRLNSTDAQLVDVIHTDVPPTSLSLGFGISDPCGHVDFYPNDGKQQPGCNVTENLSPLALFTEGIKKTTLELLFCNHVRAFKLFIESINLPCPYIAYKCNTFEFFLQGKCFSCKENDTECAIMGLNTVKPSHEAGAKYFFSTGKDAPYFRWHYKVTLDLAKPPMAADLVNGLLTVSLYNDKGIIEYLDLTPNGGEQIKHGTSRSFVVTLPDNIGKVTKVEVNWESVPVLLPKPIICVLKWCNLYVGSVGISVMLKANDDGNKGEHMIQVDSKLCSQDARKYAVIASKTSAVFDDQCDDHDFLN